MKGIFKKKKKTTKPSQMVCDHCRSKKVGCHAKDGIGTPCQNCIKANRACEWPLTPGQDPATIRRSKGSRSCASCKSKRIRCDKPVGINGPCATCVKDGMLCSFSQVAAPIQAEQPIAGPSNQGLPAAGSDYFVPGHQFVDGTANGAYLRPPWLAIDTSSTMANDSGESVTPSSGPSSPRSYWEIVLGQECSAE
ncbi:hypothetical protein V8D89_007296 [Ganoderma adspersum]